MTAADIRREHNEALISLSPKQRRAVQRLVEMRQLGAIGQFSGRTVDERLNVVCEREARRSNPLDALFVSGPRTAER